MADVLHLHPLSLHDRVAAQLRTMLIEGEIAPGAKLNERTLCERLQVSRTPLREAIKLIAAERIGDAARAEVRALHYEMLACHARRDLSGYYRLNAAIHRAINDAAGNPVLERTYRSVNARVQALRFRTNQDERKWQTAVDEHGRMVDALDARDANALHDVLVVHLQHKRDSVLALLAAGALYLEAARA